MLKMQAFYLPPLLTSLVDPFRFPLKLFSLFQRSISFALLVSQQASHYNQVKKEEEGKLNALKNHHKDINQNYTKQTVFDAKEK